MTVDSLLIVSFGGPEGRDDVLPFLENVLRGRNVPRERMLAVAEHYYHFDGVSPINAQVRALIAALRTELDRRGVTLPIYWGNRNWHPLLTDVVPQMARDGRRHAVAFVTAAYSSYSSCRQYREDVEKAQAAAGPDAPRIDKIRVFYNHPRFIAANVAGVRSILDQIPAERRAGVRIAFTAHSIPTSMASGCRYVEQLTEAGRLVAEAVGVPPERWDLVYQSRSGRPEDPWLEPDIVDHLRSCHERGTTDVIVLPIGFLSDHLEVLFDLDVQAQEACAEWGLTMWRAPTVGVHPEFVAMTADLIQERLGAPDRPALGHYGPAPDVCAVGCCPAPPSRPRPVPLGERAT